MGGRGGAGSSGKVDMEQYQKTMKALSVTNQRIKQLESIVNSKTYYPEKEREKASTELEKVQIAHSVLKEKVNLFEAQARNERKKREAREERKKKKRESAKASKSSSGKVITFPSGKKR